MRGETIIITVMLSTITTSRIDFMYLYVEFDPSSTAFDVLRFKFSSVGNDVVLLDIFSSSVVK